MARTSRVSGGAAGPRAAPAAGTLLTWLSSAAFPADRALLVDAARSRRAPAWLVDSLRRLPSGSVFQSAEHLARALRTLPLVSATVERPVGRQHVAPVPPDDRRPQRARRRTA
jgi:hypothetical protein